MGKINPVRVTVFLLLLGFMVSACTQDVSHGTPTIKPVTTVTENLREEQSGTEQPTTTPPTADDRIWFAEDMPPALMNHFQTEKQLVLTGTIQDAKYQIQPGYGEVQVGIWQYYIIEPFFCTQDGISSQAFLSAWENGSDQQVDFPDQWLVTSETYSMLSSALGTPQIELKVLDDSVELLTTAWADATCNIWAIVPFEDLRNEWKILLIDEMDPFSVTENCLTVPIFSNTDLPDTISPLRNFNPENLTTVNMTGVTALVRATAATMERYGILYPAEDIGEILGSSDFTHISNEVSFSPDCPFPQYTMDELKFCSSSDYLPLLSEIGVDIVELTGDHLEDWGVDALRYTLNIYKDEGWMTYGGGIDLAAAQTPLYIDHHGNHLMFIGCNAKSPAYAHASIDYPGTWYCDWDIMSELIKNGLDNGYLPIVTIQHKEYDQAQPTEEMIHDFHFLAEKGAVVVLGSQAHQPQTFDFSSDAFLHYGLGNLFFDQYNESLENRDAFIDHFTFYDNRLINTRLYTSVFVDWAKPVWMTEDEREMFLSRIFNLSNWDIEIK